MEEAVKEAERSLARANKLAAAKTVLLSLSLSLSLSQAAEDGEKP